MNPDRITHPLERLAYALYENAALRAEQDRSLGLSGMCNFVGLGNPLLFMDDCKADGVVMHWLRSCRGTTIGQIYTKNLITELCVGYLNSLVYGAHILTYILKLKKRYHTSIGLVKN